jgi:DNA (cytosine-5)-methyltransferase 1
MRKISEYLTIDKAAKFLGVHSNTIRQWDRTGKIKALRNPLNRYRLYLKEDLESLLSKIEHQEVKV